MPRKEFESFTRLDASDVNTYLMDQSVMTFAGTAARGSAITTPIEGMVTYLNDSNSLQLWDGARWTSAGGVSSGNAVINGGFDIWQRGTSGLTIGNSLTNAFSADRWSSYRAANHTAISVSRQSASGVPGAPSLARIQRTAANSSTETIVFGQTIEIANAATFAGQSVTFSYYLRAGANYSASGSSILAKWKSGTGSTDLNGIYNAYPGTVDANATHVLSSSFQRFSQTILVPSNATQIAISFEFTPTGTAGAADFFEITGVQIEAGSVATPFRRNANSLQGELAACQRYYFRNTATSLFSVFGQGRAQSTTSSRQLVNLPVTMRVQPTSVDFSTLRLSDGAAGNPTVTALTIQSDTSHNQTMTVTADVASGLTANQNFYLYANNSTSAFIGFSAEL